MKKLIGIVIVVALLWTAKTHFIDKKAEDNGDEGTVAEETYDRDSGEAGAEEEEALEMELKEVQDRVEDLKREHEDAMRKQMSAMKESPKPDPDIEADLDRIKEDLAQLAKEKKERIKAFKDLHGYVPNKIKRIYAYY